MTAAGLMMLAQQQQNVVVQSSNSQELMVWAIILIGVALLLFVIEIFLPSGGVIGTASALCLVAGVVMFYWIDPTLGVIWTLVTLIALPFGIVLALKVWPHTPVGRILTLGNVDAVEGAMHAQTQRAARLSLVGKRGVVVSELHPGGECEIDGQRYECVAIGSVIGAGSPIEVVSSDGMTLHVREAPGS